MCKEKNKRQPEKNFPRRSLRLSGMRLQLHEVTARHGSRTPDTGQGAEGEQKGEQKGSRRGAEGEQKGSSFMFPGIALIFKMRHSGMTLGTDCVHPAETGGAEHMSPWFR